MTDLPPVSPGPDDSHACEDVRILRMQTGAGQAPDGWVHRKSIPFAIVVQPTDGWYVVTGPDGAVTVASGEIALVAADTPVAFAHHAGAGGTLSMRWLHLQALYRQAIDPCALYRTPHCISGRTALRIGSLLGQLVLPAPAFEDRIQRVGQAYAVLALALSSASSHERASELLAAAARFGPLTAWLRENLHRPLTIHDVAVAAGLSRSRLHALFQTHLGRSPMGHLKELRLAAASRALLTTSDTVAQVAQGAGFANPFHLSREFSRRYGMPPRRYRDEQRLSFLE
jgi:AraC-like DNA-binding protein